MHTLVENTFPYIEMKELNMVDNVTASSSETVVTPPVDPVQTSIAVLEARVTELENVVHALAPIAPPEHHGVILPWLDKVGKRIQGLVEGL